MPKESKLLDCLGLGGIDIMQSFCFVNLPDLPSTNSLRSDEIVTQDCIPFSLTQKVLCVNRHRPLPWIQRPRNWRNVQETLLLPVVGTGLVMCSATLSMGWVFLCLRHPLLETLSFHSGGRQLDHAALDPLAARYLLGYG